MYILRWLAVLPVTVLIMILVTFILKGIVLLVFWLNGWAIDNLLAFGTEKVGLIDHIMHYIAAPGVSTALAIYGGSKTAPLHRKYTSIFLGVIIFGMYVFSVFASFTITKIEPWWTLVSSIAVLFGALYMIGQFLEFGDDYELDVG